MYEQKNNELYHYGVVGMKWGVRREGYRQANKLRRSYRRHVTSDIRNLRQRDSENQETSRALSEAETAYSKARSRIYFSGEKKKQAYAETEKNVDRAYAANEKTHGKLIRAKNIYEEDAKIYKDHIDSMISKYGSESVKSLKTKLISIGEDYTYEVYRTGINAANFPIIGTMLSGKYTSKKESEYKRDLMDERAKTKY